MKSKVYRLLLAAAMMFGANVIVKPSFALDQSVIDTAKKEGEVTWYTGLIVNLVVRPIADGFEKKYGVKVNIVSIGDAETLLRITNETRAGKMTDDVFDSSGAINPTLIQAGMMEKYQPESAADYAPELKDKNGYWTSVVSLYLTAAINTNMVSAADAPKNFQDLLDPKWKGKIVWTASNSSAGAAGFIANVLGTMGNDAGMDYLKKLAQQKITNFTGNQRVVMDQVIAGNFPLALMVYNHHASISAGKGAPVQWLKIEPLVADLTTVGIVKNAPHPNAAKLLVEYMFSEEGQRVIADAGYPPSHPKVVAKDPAISPNTGKFKTRMPEVSGDALKGWLKIRDDLFKS